MSSSRNLKLYAAMSASFLALSPNAVGGAVVAPAKDAHAAPVLTEFDPNRDHSPFELLAPLAAPSVGAVRSINTTFTSSSYDLDFDNDADRELQLSHFSSSSTAFLNFDGTGAGDHGVSFIATVGNNYAAKLSAGYAVGSGANWMAGGGVLLCDSSNGPWAAGASTEYLGVKINLNGSEHYGWIEISFDATGDCAGNMTIHRIGYETDPNTTIPTAVSLSEFSATEAETSPWQIATLSAALMTAMTGLFAWFRRKQSA